METILFFSLIYSSAPALEVYLFSGVKVCSTSTAGRPSTAEQWRKLKHLYSSVWSVVGVRGLMFKFFQWIPSRRQWTQYDWPPRPLSTCHWPPRPTISTIKSITAHYKLIITHFIQLRSGSDVTESLKYVVYLRVESVKLNAFRIRWKISVSGNMRKIWWQNLQDVGYLGWRVYVYCSFTVVLRSQLPTISIHNVSFLLVILKCTYSVKFIC